MINSKQTEREEEEKKKKDIKAREKITVPKILFRFLAWTTLVRLTDCLKKREGKKTEILRNQSLLIYFLFF